MTTKPYRVLVTGSRDWHDRAAVDDMLTAIAAANAFSERSTVVVHGGCPTGADRLADDWARRHARRNPLIEFERHRANWRPNGVFDRAAGFRRNAEMVDLGADVVLAFIAPCSKPDCREPKPHGSHGATHCADLAEQAGITVRRITT